MEELSLIHKTQLTQDKSAPLLLLVHGRAGNVDVMWTFKSYFPKNFNVVSVQAPLVDQVGGFSWWHVHEGINKEQVLKSTNLISVFINEFINAYQLTPKMVIGAGFSQGAGLLSVLIQTKPALFKGVALLAGFVLEEKALSANELPLVYMAHGTKDDVISLDKAILGKNYLEANHYQVAFVTDEVTHKVGTTGMRGLREFLLQFA